MKDKDKILFLTSILKVFVILFISSFIIRLIGFDKFGVDFNNEILNKIAKIVSYVNFLYSIVILYFSSFVIFKFICSNKNNKVYHVIATLTTITNMIIQTFIIHDFDLTNLYTILNIFILIIGIFIIEKKIPVKKTIIVFLINILYQAIAMFIRNITFKSNFMPLYDILLQFDYMILLVISYLLLKMKGSEWICSGKVVGSFLPQQIFLKKSAIKSPRNSLSKQEKVSEVIYLILNIFWNLLTLMCVIFICTLNTTFITAIFLLTSFLITKSTFGEAFHMKSTISCFIVSNLVYFAVSKITFSVNISFLVPIIIGVGISYVTSLFVRKNTKDLYRGMNEEIIKERSKNTELNDYEINLLVDFYSKKMTLDKMALKNNYSKEAIVIHKRKAKKKYMES